MLAAVAAQLAAFVAAAVLPVEPAGCRDSLVRFRGRGPLDPAAGEEELAAVGAEVPAEAVVGTIRVRPADDAPAPEVVLRDDSGSGEDAAAVAVVVASKAVAAAVADDGTTEVAPSSCFGCFADHPAAVVVGDTDDDLDAAAAAAADEPSFLRIGSVALVPEADSALGQSLANGCFAPQEVVPCSAVAAVVDADDVADTAVVADDDAPAAAAAAADGDCHPSGSPP